jgi:anti-sigma B factor antagonist
MTQEDFAGELEGRAQPVAARWAISVSGEFDVATAPQLKRALDDALQRSRRRIVVDFAALESIDRRDLAALLAARRRQQSTGFAIANPSTLLRRLIELVGVGTEMFAPPSPPPAAGPPLSSPPAAGRRPL